MNSIGAVAALATFLSIWFGHVAVRKIEAGSPNLWTPSAVISVLGLLAGFLSLSIVNRQLSAVSGIFAITLLFDALELRRQQNRVRKGHAPANPNNPRHAKFLADPNLHTTTQDLLKREPAGHSLPSDEASFPSTL